MYICLWHNLEFIQQQSLICFNLITLWIKAVAQAQKSHTPDPDHTPLGRLSFVAAVACTWSVRGLRLSCCCLRSGVRGLRLGFVLWCSRSGVNGWLPGFVSGLVCDLSSVEGVFFQKNLSIWLFLLFGFWESLFIVVVTLRKNRELIVADISTFELERSLHPI